MGRNADDIIGGHGAAAALHILISSFPPLGFSSRRPPARCRWTAKSWRHKVGPRSSAALRRQSRRGIGGGVDGALRARRKGARWMIGLPARLHAFWVLAGWYGRMSGTPRMDAIVREDKDNIIEGSRALEKWCGYLREGLRQFNFNFFSRAQNGERDSIARNRRRSYYAREFETSAR